jgi:hypothetical protein
MSQVKAAQLKTITECLEELRARFDAIDVAIDTAPTHEKAQEWVNRESGHGRAYLERAETLLGVNAKLALPAVPVPAKGKPGADVAPRDSRRRGTKRKTATAKNVEGQLAHAIGAGSHTDDREDATPAMPTDPR